MDSTSADKNKITVLSPGAMFSRMFAPSPNSAPTQPNTLDLQGESTATGSATASAGAHAPHPRGEPVDGSTHLPDGPPAAPSYDDDDARTHFVGGTGAGAANDDASANRSTDYDFNRTHPSGSYAPYLPPDSDRRAIQFNSTHPSAPPAASAACTAGSTTGGMGSGPAPSVSNVPPASAEHSADVSKQGSHTNSDSASVVHGTAAIAERLLNDSSALLTAERDNSARHRSQAGSIISELRGELTASRRICDRADHEASLRDDHIAAVETELAAAKLAVAGLTAKVDAFPPALEATPHHARHST